MTNFDAHVKPQDFHRIVSILRHFFTSKGYIETHPQSRLSILAACEDPHNLATFDYFGTKYPLPQTGQMWLEHDLLTNPELPGLFCVTTSYRYEPNPIPGRHNTIFPMFEFEGKGNFDDLIRLLKELFPTLGFNVPNEVDYTTVASYYQVKDINHKVENLLTTHPKQSVLLTHFPEYTAPFWNMKRRGNYALKADIILNGMECGGSAERETNSEKMLQSFYSIPGYAEKLFHEFGHDRIMAELSDFLALPMIPRFGGGFGITRLVKAVNNLLGK